MSRERMLSVCRANIEALRSLADHMWCHEVRDPLHLNLMVGQCDVLPLGSTFFSDDFS